LRGFDQIPQFSLEAMKYHSREALDWFKDVMSSFYEGGQRTGMGGLGGGVGGFRGGFAPMGRQAVGPRRNPTNPVSHQTQVDIGSGGDGAEGGDFVGGFVRPTGTPRPQNTVPRTNPISHQSQVNAQQHQQQRQKPSREPTPPLPQANSVTKDTGPATREERAFMLGDDDDEEDVATGAAPAKSNVTATPGRHSDDQGAIRL
ncbi:hypothetical protein MPER_05823, partial [Moniliophthora perniciosa FA553]